MIAEDECSCTFAAFAHATPRTAGLADSRRDGKIVFHSLTPAGRTLVDAHLAATEAWT